MLTYTMQSFLEIIIVVYMMLSGSAPQSKVITVCLKDYASFDLLAVKTNQLARVFMFRRVSAPTIECWCARTLSYINLQKIS